MPFAWNQAAPPRIGQVDAWDVPLNKWLDVKFAHGRDYTLGRAVSEFTEDEIYDGPDRMTPELANKVWGIPGFLKFEEPIAIQRAALMRKRKESELERLAYLEGASHSWASGKAVAGFVANVAGGFAHPLDAATAFIPFVGSEAKASALAKMGAGSFRQALARGILTEESLKFGRLTTAVVDGVLSQAAVELPVAFEKARNQADYTAEDSAINILGGGLFAGGIHLTARGIAALWRRGAEMHSRLNPETRDALFREQERAFVEGDKPASERIINLDEEAIRAKVIAEQFDEPAARAIAEQEIAKSEAEIVADVKAELGQVAETGIEAINRADFVRLKAPEGTTFIRTTDIRGRSSVVPIETFKRGNVLKGTDIVQIEAGNIKRGGAFNPIAGDVKVTQTAGKGRKPLLSSAEIEAKVREEKTRRIQDYIETERDRWTHSVESRISAERTAEIARQQAEGKILPPEEIKKYAASQVPKAAEITAVKEDITILEREALDRALTPEEKEAVAAELKALDDEVYTDQVKQIRAAVPCVGKVQL